MIYGRTPFGHIKRKFEKQCAIVADSVDIPFPACSNSDALDIIKVCGISEEVGTNHVSS